MSPSERNTSFDRVKPRQAAAPPVAPTATPRDAQGKRALFSTDQAVPALGSVTVTCKRCHQRSVLSVGQALRTAVPSLHLPLPSSYRSYLRCPACSHWAWVQIGVRL